MGLQALQTERMRVPDQQPEDALAQRQVADRCVLLVGEPTGDEVDQPPSVTDHSQRAVPGSGDPARRDHGPIEHAVQVEVGADRDHRVQQCLSSGGRSRP